MKVATHGRSALSFGIAKAVCKIHAPRRRDQDRSHSPDPCSHGIINHPVVGDEIYNEGRDNTVADTNARNAIKSMARFFLHAEKLSFTHPKTGERLEFVQPLPTELTDFLEKLDA